MQVPKNHQYTFQRFTGSPGGRRDIDMIAIQKAGIITLSQFFYQTNGISNFRYVTFLYDQARRTVGLFFHKEKQEDSSKITHNDRITAIAARKFLRFANIDPLREHGRFSYKKVDTAGRTLYVFELPKA